MATTQQKEDLIEAFKGPFHYRVRLYGYGGETTYMRISKEAYDFWSAIRDEHGESDVMHYILHAEDNAAEDVKDDADYEDIDPKDIPRDAMFMHDSDGDGYTWYEPVDEFDHTYGVVQDSAYLSVEQVESEDYNARGIKDVVEDEDLNDFMNRVGDDSDWEHDANVEDHDYGDDYPEKGTYICQFVSMEKGTFVDTQFTSALPFDQNKLKFAIGEAPNGEDLVYAVYYDGEELDNNGGDTNGKGYSVYFYKQEY